MAGGGWAYLLHHHGIAANVPTLWLLAHALVPSGSLSPHLQPGAHNVVLCPWVMTSRAEEHAPKPSPNLPQLEPGLPDPTCVQIYALDL